jgi:hypothetical protein
MEGLDEINGFLWDKDGLFSQILFTLHLCSLDLQVE